MYHVLISGYYGFGNCGDDAILFAITRNLKRLMPDIKITVISMNPEETSKHYGVESINRINVLGILRALKSCDLLLSGGGSLLQDITSTRSILYFLSIIHLAKKMGKKVMLYANGIGPIHKQSNRDMVHKIINQVDLITLRDHDSYKELEELKINRPTIKITADPVFTLDELISNGKQNENGKDKKVVGISLRQWKNIKYEKVIAEFADYVYEKYGFDIVFLPTQSSQDLEINRKVMRLMKNPSTLIGRQETVQDWVNLIGRLHILVSMRLHPLIFAAMQCRPMIGLSYADSKIESFLKLVDQPSAGNIEDLDLAGLCKIFDDEINNYDNITLSLRAKVDVLKEKAHENDRMVVDLLSGPANGKKNEK